jgi:hypothetical protein
MIAIIKDVSMIMLDIAVIILVAKDLWGKKNEK